MLEFRLEPSYKGQGISKGVPRGVLVYYKGKNLTQEGMGLGTVALRSDDSTFLARQMHVLNTTRDTFEVEYFIDSKIIWTFFGIKSPFITKTIENLTNTYMDNTSLQPSLLFLNVAARKLLNIKPSFVSLPETMSFRVKHMIDGNSIQSILHWNNSSHKIFEKVKFLYILNELGGNYFTKMRFNNQILPPPTGWMPKKDHRYLYSPDLNLAFDISLDLDSGSKCTHKIFIGRESIWDFNWAGYDIEISLKDTKSNKLGEEKVAEKNFAYIVNFRVE